MKKFSMYRLLAITIIFSLLSTSFPVLSVNAAVTIRQLNNSSSKVTSDEFVSNNSTTDVINFTEQSGPTPPGEIQSLSGSQITFFPAGGGATGYVPGVPTTLYFKSDVYTTDFEWLYNTWLKFPTDWTITNITVTGTPTCTSPTGAWGNFELIWETQPHEAKIQHSAIMENSDHCVATYAIEVTPGASSSGDVLVSWYYEGDTGEPPAATPHYPCSDDNYTPASQVTLGLPCDEADKPQASIPQVVNTPPVALDQTVTTPQNVAISITLSATDVENSPLTYEVVAGPSFGELTGTPPNMTYTPPVNYIGPDSFTFRAYDGIDYSNTALVSITVTDANTAPFAQSQAVTTPEDIAREITLVATDAENDPLTYLIVTPPAHGSFSGTIPNFIYTPDLNYNGPDMFEFKANDSKVDSKIAKINITITAVNDLPIAQGQTLTTAEDTPIGITLVATDVESVLLNYSIVAGPAHGGLTGTPPNVTYSPAANYYGSDTFTFKANDGTSDSNVATVTITITPVNDAAPVAQDKSVTTDEDTPVAITLVATDVDLDPITYIIAGQPLNGSVTLVDNVATYTPDFNFFGGDSFTFKANDGFADGNVATVTITVNAVNDAPVAVDDAYGIAEDGVLIVAAAGVLTNDNDVDSTILTAIKVTDPANGAVTLNSDGSLTYTPNANFNGTDSFTYKANDGTDDSNTATVTITVSAVNDVPVAVDDAYGIAEDGILTVEAPGLLTNDTDIDSITLTALKVTDPANGTLVLNANGSFTYTPNANFNGTDSFTYKANDGTDDSNTATVTITVTPAPLTIYLPLIFG